MIEAGIEEMYISKKIKMIVVVNELEPGPNDEWSNLSVRRVTKY